MTLLQEERSLESTVQERNAVLLQEERNPQSTKEEEGSITAEINAGR